MSSSRLLPRRLTFARFLLDPSNILDSGEAVGASVQGQVLGSYDLAGFRLTASSENPAKLLGGQHAAQAFSEVCYVIEQLNSMKNTQESQ